MSKVLVEFVNTWPTCNGISEFVKEIGEKYKDKIDCKIYYAGKDVSYIKKYGPIMRGTLIIDEKKKIDRLSRSVIENAIKDAIR